MTITCFCCDVSPEECLTLRAINEEARERAAGAQSITISRDTYELYKEAAEEWARGQKLVDDEIGAKWCSHCKSSWLIHAHDCAAAEILGLEREGEG